MSNITRKYSARIIPELEKSLHENGFMTALVTLDAARFKHYLKKPANLLHDRWSYVDKATGRTLLYRIGGKFGLRQELTVDRAERKVTLRTVDAKAGVEQTLVYDMVQKCVKSNRISWHKNGLMKQYDYIFLNKREGLRREVKVAEAQIA